VTVIFFCPVCSEECDSFVVWFHRGKWRHSHPYLGSVAG